MVSAVFLEDVDGQGGKAAAIFLGSMAGAVLTPSAGHWYAGKIFTCGMGVRGLGLLTFAVGVVLSLDVAEGKDISETGSTLFVIGGVGLLAAGAIDDIVTAQHAEDYEING